MTRIAPVRIVSKKKKNNNNHNNNNNKNATNVGSRAVLAAVLPGALLTLIPKVWLVVCLKVFPVLRLLTRVWCMALWAVLLLNVPKPLPHLGVDPLCLQSPLLVLALVMCGLMKVLLFPPPAPMSSQPVNQVLPPGPPPGCAAPLPVGPVVDSVADQLRALELLSSFMDPHEIEALRSRLVPLPSLVPF